MAKSTKKKMSRRKSSTPLITNEYTRYSVEDLLLDPENPRLAELKISSTATEFDLLKQLWDKMAVEELAMSIAYNGYFDYEPLFIEKQKNGKYYVIEGNRRLAAVKVLTNPEYQKKLRAHDVPKLNAKQIEALKVIPAIETTREQIWRYIGFKHVNGPATWGAYAKAQYIAKVHNEYGVPLEEIANQIGDYTNTVERQYHGLMVVEQAEKAGVFKREQVPKTRFEFSHIYTALGHEGFRKYLGLKEGARTERKPVPASRIQQLGEVMEWIYGNEERGIEPRMRTQAKDLPNLGRVLLDKRGVQALKDGLPIELAHEISQGDEHLFRKSLQEARQSLQKAHGTLTTGFKPEDQDAIELAKTLERLSTDLVDKMAERQVRPRRSR